MEVELELGLELEVEFASSADPESGDVTLMSWESWGAMQLELN